MCLNILGYISIFILVVIITYLMEGTLICPNILFSFMWCLGAILNLKHLAGIYGISHQTNMYICVSIIAFNIAYLLCSKHYKVKMNAHIHDITFQSKKLFVSNILSYIIMLPILVRAIKILNSLNWNFSLIRKFENPQYGMFTSLHAKVWAWIVYPIFMVTVIYTMILISHREVKYKWMVLSIIDVGMYTLLYGGRTAIVKMIFYFIFGMVICNREYMHKMAKLIKKYSWLIIVGGGLLVSLTNSRSLKGLSVVENALIYFFGSFTFFDVITNSRKFYELNAEMLYGRGSFGFLLSPFLYLIQKIFGTNNITGEYLIKNVTDNFVMISNDIRYNAMGSDLYIFWRDGRIYGIIIGHIFLACLVVFFRKHALAYKNVRWYSTYIYVIYILFTSTMLYDLLSIQSGIMLFLLFFYSKDTKKKAVRLVIVK